MTSVPRSYEEWEAHLPQSVTEDSLWKMKVYRQAVFLMELTWHDTRKLISAKVSVHGIADQLYRAIGSVGANISEGYSRKSNKDRARFYEYALGSARESKHWYLSAKPILGNQVVEDRLNRLSEIIRLLITMTNQQRTNRLSETSADYELNIEDGDDGNSTISY